MFRSIFSYEFINWLRKPVCYLYGLVFFGIAFISMAGTGGLFDPHTPAGSLQRFINSPFEINFIVQYFNKFFLFLLPAVIGATVYKDFRNNTHSILYTFPIKKGDYFLGKFLSSFSIVVLITFSMGLGMMIAEQLPGLDPNKVGAFRFIGYFQVYAAFILPNMFCYGLVVFCLVLWFRNIYAGFIGVVLLFFLQIITENAFDGFSVALLDPFGQNAAKYVTQFWSLEDQNTLTIPVLGVVLYNRLLWLGLALLFSFYTYKRFSFSEHGTYSFTLKRKKKPVIESEGANKKIKLSKVRYRFSRSHQWKHVWQLSRFQLSYIVKSWMFVIVTALGILAVLFAIGKVTNTNEMALLPTTGLVLTIPAFFFSTIIMLLTFIYSGMLVHRERSTGIDSLVDSTPTPNWVQMFSKVLTLLKMQGILLLVMLLAGILIQLYNGYFQFDIGLYLFHLYIILFIPLLVWACTSIFVHTLFPNPYIGIFILLLVWVGVGSLEQVGITTRLLKFNTPGVLAYSDLNGYGRALPAFFLTQWYWLIFGLLLLLLSYGLWYRGTPSSFKDRMKQGKQRFRGPVVIYGSILLTAFIAMGFLIYDKEAENNKGLEQESNLVFEKFEERFGKYAGTLQPRIVDVETTIHLYPDDHSFHMEGSYKLINKLNRPIDTLLVKTGFDEISEIDLNREFEVVTYDSYFKFSVIKLGASLRPNDSLRFDFKVKNTPDTFFQQNSSVLENGTFLMTDILPRIGYMFGNEKLQPENPRALQNHFQASDSDLVHFKTVVSTSEDQIALAPGYLQKEWMSGDRRYFQYQMESDIKFIFAVNSGVYQIGNTNHKGIELSIYHHKGHETNLNAMMDGLKAAIDFNTALFGPYQHREARIIEFPMSLGSYATTMANNIPTSEMRFIANTKTSEDKIDIAFYVSAHELTHQWWGNQIIPANALGARFISESVTDYLSFMIYGKRYGKEEGQRWLSLQRQRYLNGRTPWKEDEPPLILVDEQQPIFYGKGTLALNAMRHYLGEVNLHKVLNDFLQDYKFKEAPYPTSLELVERLRIATPDSLKYVVSDLFETVTFTEASIQKASVSMSDSEKYEMNLELSVRKQTDDTPVEVLCQHIEIGIYDLGGEIIQMETIKVTEEISTLKIILGREPARVVVDPNMLLIERERNDNEYAL
ncbi:MAG: M1 family aminopeptidase [Bacteroidota bacterium]